MQSMNDKPLTSSVAGTKRPHRYLHDLLELSSVLNCENIDEVESHMMDKWHEVIESQNKEIYEEMKAIVRQRSDFEKDLIEGMIKGLP